MNLFIGIFHRCDQCEYKCSYRSNLRRHIMSEHQGIRYHCEKCGYAAKDKGALSTHIKTVHDRKEKGSYGKYFFPFYL